MPLCLEADDTSEVEWNELMPELTEHKLLENNVMLNDSHTPPDYWDWSTLWRCDRDGCGVSFVSREQYLVERAIVFVLNKDKTDNGKKERAARAARHLKLHPSNQEEFHRSAPHHPRYD